MQKLIIPTLLFLFTFNCSYANNGLQIFGYVDTYYTIDNDKNTHREFSSINYERDQFALNIAYLLFNYNSDNYRVKIGLQEGDIPKNIYFQEPQNIQQANIGVRLFENLWLTGGIMTTHIGGEGTHPRVNFLSSHSNTTFYEPTYQTGFALQYQANDELSFGLMLINGNHLFADNNKQKTVGFNINYEKDGFNAFYSTIFGNEEPTGTPSKLHSYHDFFVSKQMSDALEIRAQIDIGTLSKNTGIMNFKSSLFYSGFFQSRYKISEKIYASARYTYFSDIDDVYQTDVAGYDLTAGIEYKPVENSYIRLESRYMKLNAGDNKYQFLRDNNFKDSRLEFSLNFGLYFDLLFKNI